MLWNKIQAIYWDLFRGNSDEFRQNPLSFDKLKFCKKKMYAKPKLNIHLKSSYPTVFPLLRQKARLSFQ